MSPRVGILSTRDHPLVPYLLDAVDRYPRVTPVLIFDRRGIPSVDRDRIGARTGGAFPRRDEAEWLAGRASIDVDDHNAATCADVVRSEGLVALLNGGTPRRLGAPLLAAAPVINVHPGILPGYRGSSAFEWAVYNDDPVGVTAHLMDETIDTGPIIGSRDLVLRRGQGYEAARTALYRLQLDFGAEILDRWAAGLIAPAALRPQPEGRRFPPMPDELLAVVRRKLERAEYAYVR